MGLLPIKTVQTCTPTNRNFYSDDYKTKYLKKQPTIRHTVWTNGLQHSPTVGPDLVQHLLGNNIFCCKQVFGCFWDPEVEQKLTEAAAVCNLPCREVERAREKRQRPCDSFYFFSMEHLDKGTEMPSKSLENNTYKTIF